MSKKAYIWVRVRFIREADIPVELDTSEIERDIEETMAKAVAKLKALGPSKRLPEANQRWEYKPHGSNATYE